MAPPRILVVDDVPNNVKLLADLLELQGYEVSTASGGLQALARIAEFVPDLVLLDVMMPDMNGYEVCKRIRANPSCEGLPVVMVTALDATEERIKGLQAGADDFIGKPFNRTELMARVKSLLRVKRLHDQLVLANASLEQRVSDQLAELERLGALKRFLSPRVRALVQSGEIDNPFLTRRREVSVVFADLRGFTAFTETAEPEEVMAVLRKYHAVLGAIVMANDGAVEHFAGDGVMILFNDPLPVANHELTAIRVALEIRDSLEVLSSEWNRQGFELGFGVGIAAGFATLGAIGFEGRREYAAIGTVCNLAARLCGEALSGQVLITQRIANRLESALFMESVGELKLKGISRVVNAFNVIALRNES